MSFTKTLEIKQWLKYYFLSFFLNQYQSIQFQENLIFNEYPFIVSIVHINQFFTLTLFNLMTTNETTAAIVLGGFSKSVYKDY